MNLPFGLDLRTLAPTLDKPNLLPSQTTHSNQGKITRTRQNLTKEFTGTRANGNG
jgi:hypothetical protein